jgi:hypothetical protein
MRLVDLDPRFFGVSDGRTRVGVDFECPHCAATGIPKDERERIPVPFTNPLDGGAPLKGQAWQRTGDTFDTMSLTPSVDGSHFGHWHGYITNGEIVGGI